MKLIFDNRILIFLREDNMKICEVLREYLDMVVWVDEFIFVCFVGKVI